MNSVLFILFSVPKGLYFRKNFPQKNHHAVAPAIGIYIDL